MAEAATRSTIREMNELLSNPLALAGGGAVAVAMVVYVVLARRRQRRDEAALARARQEDRHLPASLHPLIDTDICIGSLACVSACPEGDVLGLVKGAGALVHGGNCIGHGACAAECPVGAIKLVFGTSERGVDLPKLDDRFETSRPGVHIVGELGGMGLIRNAMVQGLEVAAYLRETLGPRAAAARGDAVDVAIVGAGPAGLATALGCQAAGLTYRLLEQGTLGGTVTHFPRQKVVMTERVDLPLYGRFGKSSMSKEDLLGSFGRIVAKTGLRVEEGVKVTGLSGDSGAFAVETDRGAVAARKVVLAVGRRGTPRRLGVPGEDLEKVTYGLVDPHQFGKARVLVVGGGDAALEAAAALADAGAAVTLAHRSPAFNKCREANRRRIAELGQAGRLRLALSTQVGSIEKKAVTLESGGATERLGNDFVVVCAGGELPLGFLQTLGISLERHFGQKAVRAAASAPRGKAALAPAARGRPAVRLGVILFAVGGLITAALAWEGRDYYLLPHAARADSPLHESLRPAGLWGHGVGIVAAGIMLSNFLYAARKRWRLLRRASSIRSWLTVHMFVGFMSPIAIGFHAAFQSRNLLATSTFGALLLVVGAGIIGRYIYGLVPSAAGRVAEHGAVLGQWQRLKTDIEPLVAASADPERVRRLLAPSTALPAGGSMLGAVLLGPWQGLGARLAFRRLRPMFPDPGKWRELRRCFLDLRRLRVQAGFYGGLRRLLSVWRVFHVVLALFLVMIMAVHIALSLYLGYRWLF